MPLETLCSDISDQLQHLQKLQEDLVWQSRRLHQEVQQSKDLLNEEETSFKFGSTYLQATRNVETFSKDDTALSDLLQAPTGQFMSLKMVCHFELLCQDKQQDNISYKIFKQRTQQVSKLSEQLHAVLENYNGPTSRMASLMLKEAMDGLSHLQKKLPVVALIGLSHHDIQSEHERLALEHPKTLQKARHLLAEGSMKSSTKPSKTTGKILSFKRPNRQPN